MELHVTTHLVVGGKNREMNGKDRHWKKKLLYTLLELPSVLSDVYASRRERPLLFFGHLQQGLRPLRAKAEPPHHFEKFSPASGAFTIHFRLILTLPRIFSSLF